MPSVTISARGEQRVRLAHPWIYRADVVAVEAEGGDLVEVLGPRQRVLGYALFSDRSQISIRMLSRGEQPVDELVVRGRLESALRYRESLRLDATAYRLVHGEADLLPSLIVDRYGDYRDRLAAPIVEAGLRYVCDESSSRPVVHLFATMCPK